MEGPLEEANLVRADSTRHLISAFLLSSRWLETLLYQCSFSAFLLLPHGPPLHWLRLTVERSIESFFFCEMRSHSNDRPRDETGQSQEPQTGLGIWYLRKRRGVKFSPDSVGYFGRHSVGSWRTVEPTFP